MATLAISPIPLRLNDMASRRIPLGEVPNAANSPARHHMSNKRPRDHNEPSEKSSFDLQPRIKRPALNTQQLRLRVSPAPKPLASRDDRVGSKSTVISHPTQFERRLLAAKEAGSQQRVQRQDKPAEDLAGIRRWQQHYKKAFPGFVFYFESIPEDVRARYSKIVRNLGAKEEKFFSKSVTHLVTNRSMPSLAESRNQSEGLMTQHAHTSQSMQPRTIDPALLDKSAGIQQSIPSKGKFDFDAHMRRAHSTLVRDVEQAKPQSSSVDVLFKAQELGVKIWQLNKLERILNTIFEVPSETQNAGSTTSVKRTGNASTKQQRDADLSRMLRHERLHGPSDRAASGNLNEMVIFRGPYVLVRDMDERTRPIMAKEWPKPAKKGDSGEWPQFRAVGHGKCPFVEEVNREDLEREILRQEEMEARQAKPREASQSRPVSRAVTPIEIYEDDEDSEIEAKQLAVQHTQAPDGNVLKESEAAANARKMSKPKVPASQFCPPPVTLPPQTRSPAKIPGREGIQGSIKPIGIEPAASGVQPSNITSATRSQIISSTASAPFSRAGTLKEVHGLKRKVLEKNAGPALNSMQGKPQQDLSNCRAEAQISRARRERAQPHEALAQIGEESAQTEEDEDVWLAEDVRAAEDAPKLDGGPIVKRDPKPGYCENCREKYDDFDEHIVGRRHRRFALNTDNWKDLDRLLARLARPLKSPEMEPVDEGF